jgi:hypothetical protein
MRRREHLLEAMRCSLDTSYPHVKSVARRCANGELPSDPQTIDRHRQTLKLCKKPLSNPSLSSGESGTNRPPSLRRRRSMHQLDRYRRDIGRLGRQRRYGFCDKPHSLAVRHRRAKGGPEAGAFSLAWPRGFVHGAIAGSASSRIAHRELPKPSNVQRGISDGAGRS